MAEYTYQELMKMQNDAVRRAEDMQQKARKSAGLEKNISEKESTPVQEPRRIPMPKGYLDKKEDVTDKESATPENNMFDKFGDGLKNLNIDSDKALLLSLVMLLSEENADELLIMALLYMLT